MATIIRSCRNMEGSRRSLRRRATPLDSGRPLGSAMKNGQLCKRRQRATCLSLCGGCGGCGVVVVVVVVVRTGVLMRCVWPYPITNAPNYGSGVPVDTTPRPVPMHRAPKSLPLISASTARDALPPAEPALTCRCQAHNYPSGHAKLHGPAHEEESTARGEKSPAKPATVV